MKKYVIRDEHAHLPAWSRLISLGRAAADNVRIQDAALPILKNLSYCTREDSYLIIQVGDKGLVLDKTDGPNHLKVVEEFGYEMDLHCGAIRKRFWLSRRRIHPPLSGHRLNRPEAFPKADPAELAEELRTIREKGIAVSHGEYVPDAVGIGAPIYEVLTDAFPLRSESSHRIPVLKMTHVFCTCRIRSATVRQNYPTIWDIHLSRRNKEFHFMINKRLFLAGLTTGLLSLSVAFPAMAGSWKNGAGDNATPLVAATTVTTPGRQMAGAGSTATRTASANATISTPKADF
ncbi:MAG: IclR family transcriptional regulator C-terminal domain-containing protein [Clostridium fessum]